MEIEKIVYGLTQSGKIPNDKLKLRMFKFGYDPAPITTGFRRHQTRPLKFLLSVNYFEVKYER